MMGIMAAHGVAAKTLGKPKATRHQRSMLDPNPTTNCGIMLTGAFTLLMDALGSNSMIYHGRERGLRCFAMAETTSS